MRAVSNSVLGAVLAAAVTVPAMVWRPHDGGFIGGQAGPVGVALGLTALLVIAVMTASARQHRDMLIKMEDAALAQIRKQALLAELGKLQHDIDASPALASSSFSGGLAKLLELVGTLPEQPAPQETALYRRIAHWRTDAAILAAPADASQGGRSRGALLVELTAITRSLEGKG